MRRGQYFSGNYGSALGSYDTAAKLIAQAGQAQGQMFANLGQQIGGAIEKYAQNKKEGEAADMQIGAILQNMTPERQQEIASGESELGKSLSKFIDGELSNSKKKALLGSLMTVNTADQLKRKEQMDAQRFQQQQELTKLNMQIARQNLARQKSADQLAGKERIADNQFMQSLMSQTTSPQAQRQADIAQPGLPALGNADARNRFMQAQLQQPQNQVPVSNLGSQDFGRFAREQGLDPTRSVQRMEALRQAELANQPKPMTPKELADYESKLIANETDRIKLNDLKNPPAPPAPPEPVYMESALDAIDDAVTLVDKDSMFNPTAGFGSETAKSIGGSDAADLEAALSTITSAVGFKRLQDMREASPTGGALGSVSEKELSQLNAALGSISQKQSPEQLKKNLLKIKDHYQKAVDAINAQRIAYNSGLTFKTQEEALKYIQSQKSSNAIKTDQGDYSIEGLSVEAQ